MGGREGGLGSGWVKDAFGLVSEDLGVVAEVVAHAGYMHVHEQGRADAVVIGAGDQVGAGDRAEPPGPRRFHDQAAVHAVAGRGGGGLGRPKVGAAAVVVDGELSLALGEPRVGDVTAGWDGGVGVLPDVRSVGGVHVLGDSVDVHPHALARDLVAEVHLDA